MYFPYRFDGRVGAVQATAPVFLKNGVKTNFYIDGFNLSYRAVRETAYQWLDLFRLCQALIPNQEVNRIRYFTAAATFVRRLRPNTLRNSQFPAQLQDATGIITKPASW